MSMLQNDLVFENMYESFDEYEFQPIKAQCDLCLLRELQDDKVYQTEDGNFHRDCWAHYQIDDGPSAEEMQ